MPRIYDNIEQQLVPALRETIAVATNGDFCVGFFNLRGWRCIAPDIDRWPGGEGHCCRILVEGRRGRHRGGDWAAGARLARGDGEVRSARIAGRGGAGVLAAYAVPPGGWVAARGPTAK